MGAISSLSTRQKVEPTTSCPKETMRDPVTVSYCPDLPVLNLSTTDASSILVLPAAVDMNMPTQRFAKH
jgi:hypothetical protein